jgi:hypothetical protein
VGQLVEVLAVAVEEAGPGSPLLGANIDGPTGGRRVAAAAVEVGGWVLGGATLRDPIEVEIVHGGRVVARAPARRPRPDIAGAFPGEAGAARAGFELVLDASRIPAESTVEVRARSGSIVAPIGVVRMRRCWRGPGVGEAPLVSVIVAGPDRAEQLEATLRSVVQQRYLPTEVVVVYPGAAEPVTPPWGSEWGIRQVAAEAAAAEALRNEGIRRSNGQLIAFLEAGPKLAPGGLAGGVEALLARPEAAGLVDGPPGGDVAAAIYRRAAFEELGGFAPGSRGCDAELAGRAAAGYDLIFAPGALIAGES